MAALWGKQWTRRELLAHVGDIRQIADVRPVQFTDGMETGVRAFELYTGSGLQFTALASRGMDIGQAHYKGYPLAWHSQTDVIHPAFYEPEGFGWLRGFHGGLLNTCGLSTMGAPSEDEGKSLGLHGRASYIPASNLQWGGEWEGDEYRLYLKGTLKEAAVFQEHLFLHRTMTASLGAKSFTLHDRVHNAGFTQTEQMLLYHINLGFPIVEEGSELVAPFAGTTPRDSEAEIERESFHLLHAPRAGYKEKVYFHRLKHHSDGRTAIGVLNRERGLGVYVRLQVNQFPYLTQWKMLGQGTYTVGIEPGNALVMGRARERAEGRLQFLEPDETCEYEIEIGVLDGESEMAAFEHEIAGIMQQ
jgi:hypothetical protein